MRYAVVMAGGAGTRLWPAARRERPKQLQRLIFKEPLIAETVHRLTAVYPLDRILVVTARQYSDAIREALPALPAENVLSEPVGRNTAAAIALAAFPICRQDPEAVFAVFPADHVILQAPALYQALAFANRLALEHRVVDIGVIPTSPETGYGYIELGPEVAADGDLRAYDVRRFVEKPAYDRAREYLAAGNYIWNSGMFVWRAGQYLEALQEHVPETFERLAPAEESGDWERLADAYASIPDISVDYGIMEKVSDVVAVPADFGWRDIGDWNALWEMMAHDAAGNAFEGEHVLLDTKDSLLLAPRKLVAAIGVQDLIVVDTEDVLLIVPRERAQEVKALLDELKRSGREGYL
jgi:mannose-1-phosphate guanylyltransferase